MSAQRAVEALSVALCATLLRVVPVWHTGQLRDEWELPGMPGRLIAMCSLLCPTQLGPPTPRGSW